METCTRKSPGWSRWSPALLCAVIGLCALCVQSCRTQESITAGSRTENRQDSLLSEVRVLKAIGIPASKLTLPIPTTSLLKLPPSASYSAKSGQANVRVERKGDTIYVEASCDSLQRLCIYYQRELEHIRGQTHQEESRKEERTISFRNKLKYIGIGLIPGLLIGMIITNKRKNQ